MKHRKLFSIYLVISLLAIPLTLMVAYMLSEKKQTEDQECKTNVNIRTNGYVMNSVMPTDFVDKDLKEYEILGKWHVVSDDGYVIARKDGQLWSTYYNKKEKSVGVLIPLLTRVENGDTIIYSEQTFSGEYMVIRPKGLYLYGNNGLEPAVWHADN